MDSDFGKLLFYVLLALMLAALVVVAFLDVQDGQGAADPTYPPPNTPQMTPTSTPDPDGDYRVTGRILFDGQPPMMGVFKVGLCNVIQDGTWCVYDVNPPAPRADYNQDGFFAIEGVGPGEYGLVFDFGYFLQIMPDHPNGFWPILFDVIDGDFDLGLLAWETIPCDLIPDWRCNNVVALPLVMRGD